MKLTTDLNITACEPTFINSVSLSHPVEIIIDWLLRVAKEYRTLEREHKAFLYFTSAYYCKSACQTVSVCTTRTCN